MHRSYDYYGITYIPPDSKSRRMCTVDDCSARSERSSGSGTGHRRRTVLIRTRSGPKPADPDSSADVDRTQPMRWSVLVGMIIGPGPGGLRRQSEDPT